MSITTNLLAFGVRYLFNESTETALHAIGQQFREHGRELPEAVGKALGPVGEHLFKFIEKRLTDHGEALPKALRKANDRAWQAVGLALAGESLFGWVKDVFRDADMKGVRDQIKSFLDTTPTGLENAPAGFRAKATQEWNHLRKANRFSSSSVTAGEVAHRAASIERYSDPARMTAAAHQAVKQTAEALQADAPHLAELLTAAPNGGSPLLVAAFAFFFRRELETNTELFHGLSFEFLKLISERQDRGLEMLDSRTAGILDQIDVLFDALGEWFGRVFEELAAIRRDQQQWRHASQVAAVAADAPIVVSASNEREQQQMRAIRDRIRAIPAEFVGVADLDELGDNLDACGLFEEALSARQSAVERAKAEADRKAEADALFKTYKDACEVGRWAEGKEALARAVKLDGRRFRPFDTSRYRLDAILGVGGFGTVFRCLDTEDVDDDGNPIPVAIKSLRRDTLDRDPRTVFAEARTLRDLHRHGSRIIRVVSWGYAHSDPDDPDRKERPFIVMELFSGETLDIMVRRDGPLTVPDFLAIVRQIAEAIREAHGKNVFHRDLKPSNVMARRLADATWDVRVIDFGLAVRHSAAHRASMDRMAGRDTKENRSLTGSLDFAPPEQRGKLPGVKVGPHSDVYAFGKTCQWLLFRTTEPLQPAHWKRIPEPYRDPLRILISEATLPDVYPNPDFGDETPLRTRDFNAILAALAGLDPAGSEARQQQEHEARERHQQAEAERQRVAAAKASRIVAEQQAKAAEQERTERLELWKRSGHPKAWVEKHLDGWDHQAWSALVAELKASPYWPLKAEEIDAVVEGLRVELRTAREQRRAAEDEAKRRQEEARRKAEEEAKAKDPFHPGRVRTAGETLSIPLSKIKTGGFLGIGSKDFDVSMTFAWCPPGTFRMGSEHPEAAKIEWSKKTERPTHTVTLTKGFFMGIHPVTQAQWKAVMATEPAKFKGLNRPVEQVSWDDCQEFCRKLTSLLKERVTVRLPTEAEWEYACRAGTTSEFWFGDVIDVNKANYDGNHSWNGSPKGTYRLQTTDVGTVGAKNPWGLYDVHGNIWEWCEDAWDEAFYAKSPHQDPLCTNDQTSARVLRGGSWFGNPYACRAAYRLRRVRDCRNFLGCRVCFRLDG